MDQRSGMGREQRGPSFVPWQASLDQRTDRPLRPSAQPAASPTDLPARLRPPRNPWPTVVTLVALFVVGSITVAATIIGGRRDISATGAAAPVPVVGAAATPIPGASNRTEFVSDDGDGVLIITAARWSTAGVRPPLHGAYLHVQIRLICSVGRLSYGPSSFSAFDATGELFEVVERERSVRPLGAGVLAPGESAAGSVVFDLPRGEVTLLLSDSGSRSVTALKIPD